MPTSIITVEGCIVRYPQSTDAFELIVQAVATLMLPGSIFWLYGCISEGVLTGMKKNIWANLFSSACLLFSQNGVAVISCVRTSVKSVQSSLDLFKREYMLALPQCCIPPLLVSSNIDKTGSHTNSIIKTAVLADTMNWVVYPGLFAGGTIDIMTACLLSNIPCPRPGSSVCDFACGSGIISASLLKWQPSLEVVMLDADAIAASAAKINVPLAQVLVCDGWGNLLERVTKKKKIRQLSCKVMGSFDLIISNPPVHKGQPDSLTVVEELISGIYNSSVNSYHE